MSRLWRRTETHSLDRLEASPLMPSVAAVCRCGERFVGTQRQALQAWRRHKKAARTRRRPDALWSCLLILAGFLLFELLYAVAWYYGWI